MKAETARLVLHALLAENDIPPPKASGEKETDMQALLHAVLAMDAVPDETVQALAEIFDAVADMPEEHTSENKHSP